MVKKSVVNQSQNGDRPLVNTHSHTVVVAYAIHLC